MVQWCNHTRGNPFFCFFPSTWVFPFIINTNSIICRRYYKIFALNSFTKWKGLARLRMCDNSQHTARPSNVGDGKHTHVPNKRTKRRTVVFLNIVISVVMNVELWNERETSYMFPQTAPRSSSYWCVKESPERVQLVFASLLRDILSFEGSTSQHTAGSTATISTYAA